MDSKTFKRIGSLLLAAIIGVACGMAIEKGIHSDSHNGGKIDKNLTVVWNGEDVGDYSFMLGGLIGHFDYLSGRGDDYTNNSYYEKYNKYVDLLEYIGGYKEGYQTGGAFISYEDNNQIIEEANSVALVFEAMADGAVIKQYVTTEPDKVTSILHPDDES